MSLLSVLSVAKRFWLILSIVGRSVGALTLICVMTVVLKKPITNKYHFTHPVWGEMHCYLWLGELDDDWHPIDKFGKLVAPGVRLCGHKVCIAGDHVVEVETPPSQRKLEGATDERGQ